MCRGIDGLRQLGFAKEVTRLTKAQIELVEWNVKNSDISKLDPYIYFGIDFSYKLALLEAIDSCKLKYSKCLEMFLHWLLLRKIIIQGAAYDEKLQNSGALKFYLEYYCKNYLRYKITIGSLTINLGYTQLAKKLLQVLNKNIEEALLRDVSARDSVHMQSENAAKMMSLMTRQDELQQNYNAAMIKFDKLREHFYDIEKTSEARKQRIAFLLHENEKLESALYKAILQVKKIHEEMQQERIKMQKEMDDFKTNVVPKIVAEQVKLKLFEFKYDNTNLALFANIHK